MPNEKMEGIVNLQTETFEMDYARLESAKKELFLKLAEGSDLSHEEKNYLINRIFEHSIEDGLDLSDTIAVGPVGRISALDRPEFVKKHRDFSLKLNNRLVEYGPYVGEKDKPLFDEFVSAMSERVEQSKKMELPVGDVPPALGDKAKEILDQMDQYYANFLRFRSLKAKETPDVALSSGEQIGEHALALDEKGLEPHYYTGPIRDLFPEIDSHLLKRNLIAKKDLDQLLASANVSAESEQIRNKIEKAKFRPLDVIHDIYHQDADKLLKQELVTSLKSRGYKDKEFELVFDESSGQYKILNRIREDVEFKKRNLRVIQEAPKSYELRPGDPNYGEIYRGMNSDERGEDAGGVFKVFVKNHIVDGQLYQIVSNRRHDSYIIYPDGHTSKLYLATQGLKMTKKGLMFTINDHNRRDGSNNFQIMINEKRISEDDVWDTLSSDCFEAQDGTIYSAAHQFDFDSQIGRYAIFKDDQMIRSYPYETIIRQLTEVEGELTYILEKKYESDLVHGDKTFGPYKNIIMADNKESLTFVAEKKTGEKIAFYDGSEKPFQLDDDIRQVVKIGSKLYIKASRGVERGEARWQDKYVYYIVDQDGNKITEEASRLNYFGSMGDKLVYSIGDMNSMTLHFGDDEQTNLDSEATPIGVINGDLFYFSGKHEISSFRSGKIDFGKKLTRQYDIEDIAQIIDNKLIILTEDGDMEKLLEYSPKFRLTEDENRRLELLNTLKSESLEKINSYFEHYYPEEVRKGLLDKLRETYEHSKGFARNVNAIIKELPSLFVDDFSAKKDDVTDRNIDQIINSIFPDIRTNLAHAKWKARYERDFERSVSAYYEGRRETDDFSDGDPKAPLGPELLRLREPVTEFLSIGMYGQYNKTRKSWEQIGFPLSQRHTGPTREVTAEIKVVKYMTDVILPKCIHAVVLPERVKGIKADGEEVSLEVSYNALGEARVTLPEGLEKIVYSQTIQELPTIPPDVSTKEYELFRIDYERRFGNGVSEQVAALPEELKIFIESIKDKTPLEKAEAIESFVQSIGFYDFDNREVQALKKGKSVEEIISVMGQRMKELKRKVPEASEKIPHKKYAGVCADFAKLTSALLREAGIISGMVSGFQGSGETSLTTKNVHAISFALFPEENGKSQCLTLDGTPHGMTEEEEKMLSAIRQQSLKDRMEQLKKEKEKIVTNAETLLSELENLVSDLDEESIKRLQNGKLERALNAILGQVKESHLAVVDRVLNASRYAGFDVFKIMEIGDLESEVSLRKFLEKEISDERNADKENAYYRGEKLLSAIREFTSRYEKDSGVSGRKMALDIVQKVFDVSKKYLNAIESRSAIAAITYLRSEHMAQ